MSRLRLDASLFDEVKESQVKRRGRKRVKGKKQPTLKQRLADANLQLASGIALWL